MIIVAGGLLIGFGFLELAGRSLSFISPGGGLHDTSTLFGTYSLGMIYGFGGFCSGPILGSVLTVAATDDSVLRGGGLLAVYALGTTVPLFIVAALWDRLGVGGRGWVRGWGLELGPLSIHSTNLLAGLLFITLGVLFIALQGTNALAGTYESWGFTELSFRADEWVKDVTSPVPDVLTFGLAGLVAAAAGVYIYRRLRFQEDDDLPLEEPGESMSLGTGDGRIDQ